MSNGEQDSNYSNTRSKRRAEMDKKYGRQAMPNLLENAAKIKRWRLTNCLYLAFQNPTKPSESENPRQSNAWLRSKVYSMSDEYLAMLDKRGIKIIGLHFEQELNDTSWVNV